MFFTTIVFIVILSVIVFFHEAGHFFSARKFGIKAEEFGLGFPPRMFGVYKDTNGKWKKVRGSRKVDDASDTIYSINWFPLGGFVKIKGEDGESSEDRDSFANKPIWKRAIVLVAGVSMNIVLAFLLISAGYMIGLPQALDGVGPRASIGESQIQISDVLPDTPADKAGLKVGDIVQRVDNNSITKHSQLQNYITDKEGKKVEYRIERGGKIKIFDIKPEQISYDDGQQVGIGIGILETGKVKYPFYLAIWEGLKTTLAITWLIILAFFNLLKDLFLFKGVSVDIAGPVGIASLTGQAARMGLAHILQFAAVLSINLAIINGFPFPALDGGRLLFLLIEKLKGSPVKRETEAMVHNVGFILLMLLVLLVTFKDLGRFGGVFKGLIDKIF